MVELTIGDLVRWQPVQMALAGSWDDRRAEIETEFSWAVSIRSTTPVLPPLRGRELVIVPRTVLAELDQREAIRWPQVVANLRALPIAGVISDHPELCASVDDLVVIEVATAAGTDLEVSLNREFTERRGSLYQLGSELARTFSSASIGGSDLDGFLRLASQRTGVAVALVASTGRVLATSEPGLVVPPELASPETAGQRLSFGEQDWFSQPISGAGLPEGVFLVARIGQREPGDRARLALEQTGEALGLMFDRLPPLDAPAPADEAGEILAELALHRVLPPAARRRLNQLAGDLELDGTLRLLLELDEPSQSGLAFRVADVRLALIDESAYDRLIQENKGRYVVSPPFNGVEHVPDAVWPVTKAARMLEVGKLPGERLDLGQPGDGGALGLLLGLEYAPDELQAALAGYTQALLGALDAYDRARSMQLVETLGVFLDAGASIAEASAQLGVHRNTLAYRIARIVEVSGHDLSDPATRFDLQLAIALRRLSRA